MFAHELGDMVIAVCWLMGALFVSARLVDAYPRFPRWIILLACFLGLGVVAVLLS